jgi:hypothetical protein
MYLDALTVRRQFVQLLSEKSRVACVVALQSTWSLAKFLRHPVLFKYAIRAEGKSRARWKVAAA